MRTSAARSRGRPPTSRTTSRPAPSPTRSTATGRRRTRAHARGVSDASAARVRATPLVIAAGVVTVAMLATVGVHPYDPFGGRELVDGFALAAFLATACLALARHHSTRDPHALLVGTGFAILAGQTALFAGYATA